MKFYLLSDNIDTSTGMRLAGIEGVVIHEREEFVQKFSALAEDPEIAILLITEKLFKVADDIISAHKMSNKPPLIVKIPDRHGFSEPNDILGYIKNAIGLSI